VKSIDEPPSRPSNLVLISQDGRGHWVAQEENGLFGGMFVSRAQAVKYALFENGNHPEAIVLTNNIVELDMHRKAPLQPQTIVQTTVDDERAFRDHAA
jgi:hypothetical protein